MSAPTGNAGNTVGSLRPSARVVEAAASATRLYLDFLAARGAGVERYPAQGIRPAAEEPLFLENTVWSTYSCELPKHLSLRTDSAAALAGSGCGVEIRILDYDRRTGQAVFAAREPLPVDAREVVVDFRWLVQRCLDWLERNGPSIPDFETVASGAPAGFSPSPESEGLSVDQRTAVAAMLTSQLSYIWGPPGTGKTKWVLARAVACCVEAGERTLVLAPTNLAVDNALSAVLETGVPKAEVLRLGVPSKEFVERYPDCCEERAFEHEFRQITSQVKAMENSIVSLRMRASLTEAANETASELRAKRLLLSQVEGKLTAIGKDIRPETDLLAARKEALRSAEAECASRMHELDALSLPELLSEIDALEREQARTIRELEEVTIQLDKLGGVLGCLLPRRKRGLVEVVSRLTTHLQAVEPTLVSRRTRREEIAHTAAELQAAIGDLGGLQERSREQIVALEHSVAGLLDQQQAYLVASGDCHEQIAALEARQNLLNSELADGVPACSAEDASRSLAAWTAQKRRLERRLAGLNQDLSQKLVLGMTLDGFIGLTLRGSLTASRVFIDEAPYAPVIKVLPLLTLRCPIAMLGDHRQLPPVCESRNDSTILAYWGKEAIFLEDAFRCDQPADLHALQEPCFVVTRRVLLCRSYRFGASLAELLDSHVYAGVGLHGVEEGDTTIECVHCEPRERQGRLNRQNDAEVEAVVQWLDEWWQKNGAQPDHPTIGVLTPYRHQLDLLRKRFRETFGDSDIGDHVDILNTHKAQGREWDWVLLSVADTGSLRGNSPYYSNSRCRIGRDVLNTTISRTKKRLVVFLDYHYWRHREPTSLLTDIVTDAGLTACRSEPL